MYILLGSFAFGFLYIFDFNKIKFIHKSLNIFFGIGLVLIIFSTLGILFDTVERVMIPMPIQVIFMILSAISLYLMIYSLFFALPFKKTYMAGQKANNVIDHGMYALCRHPGVIWFCLFYLFLFLSTGTINMLIAWVVWTIMDVIHVYVQDKWIFPKSLNDYDRYKVNTPFLIPSIASIKKCCNYYVGGC